MTRLPSLSARELVAALKRAGYFEGRQTGSHLILKHAIRASVVVPMHAGEMKRHLAESIIRQAGFTKDEFIKLL